MRFCILVMLLITTAVVPSHSMAPVALPVGDGTLRRIHLPILMYHYVEELPPDADDLRRGLTVSPALFQQQLQYLRDNGYQAVTSQQVYDALRFGAPLPQRPIMLTFDDSYNNHYTIVFPLLQRYGMIGTFYVITAALDTRRKGYMTWEQAQAMAAAGMEIAAHTKNHIDLRARSFETLVYEIVGSIESVAAHTNVRPIGFAYPMGRYDEQTIQFMRSIYPVLATTTRHGDLLTSDNVLELPRVRINPDTTVAVLSRLLQR